MIYLVQYDRQKGLIVRFNEFSPGERQQAEEERLRVEQDLLARKISYEVVLLEAASEAELRKTHRRYFEELKEILATG